MRRRESFASYDQFRREVLRTTNEYLTATAEEFADELYSGQPGSDDAETLFGASPFDDD